VPAAPAKWTHDALVERAARWMRSKGCSLVLRELTTTGTSEIADALGWRGDETVLVECKTSRADFLADRRKPFRHFPESGMGRYRYYLCPPDLIKPEEIPTNWGLLYALGRTVKVVTGRNPQTWGYHWGDDGKDFQFETRNWRAEQGLLRSMLNRLKLSLGQAEFDRLIHLPYHGRNLEIEQRDGRVQVEPASAEALESELASM